jgi:hypothetical protein
MMMEVMRRSFDQSDNFHESARRLRNRLIVTTLITALVAIGLVILQGQLPTAHIFQLPNDNTDLPRWSAMLLVMIFGCVGALLTAIPAMSAIPTVSTPYNFPLPQGVLKIVVGALTALVGVVVVGGIGATGVTASSSGFNSMQALIGVAVVFGAGQQTITQFLDKKAGQLVAQPGAPS